MEYNYQTSSDYSYCLGLSLCFELIKHQKNQIDTFYIHSKVSDTSAFKQFMQLLNQHQLSYEYNDEIIESLSVKENCYVIGKFRKNKQLPKTKKHILLYEIADYGHLGTIMRSMASFEYYDLILINPQIDVDHPKVVRASMGGYFLLNIEIFKDLSFYQEKYAQFQLNIINQNSKTIFNAQNLNDYFCLVFNSKKQGTYFEQPKELKLPFLVSSVLYSINWL